METQIPLSKKKSRFILLAPLVFILLTAGIFNLLQQPAVYNATLNKVGFTYLRINNPDGTRKEIKQIKDVPFQKINNQKLTHWDSHIYWDISKDLYIKEAPNRHAFFPLFPIIWKLSHLPIGFIVLLNLSFFVIGYLFFYFIIRNHLLLSEKNIQGIYLLLLCIPSFAICAIPYAEATAFVMCSMALYFMLRKKMAFAFLFFLLLAWCRPNTLMLLVSAISAFTIFFFKTKDRSELKTPVITVIAGLFLGLISVFFYYYLSSGNFWIFFEAQKHWGTKLQLPTYPFTDYAGEVFQLNRILLFVFAPLAIIKLVSILFIEKTQGNIWLYIRLFSILYFLITCLTVLFFQGGSLHSLHRYALVNPLGAIFIIDLCTTCLRKKTLKKWIIYGGFLLLCIIILHLNDPRFLVGLLKNNNGQILINLPFIVFMSIVSLLFWLPQQEHKWQRIYHIFIGIVVFLAIVADSLLFNQFLSRGWLWA